VEYESELSGVDAELSDGSLADESETLEALSDDGCDESDESDDVLDDESSTDEELGLPDDDGLLDELLLDESVTVE
jgi:hypothetical protein